MTETILSAGIDIGTTTTQVVFSRLTLEHTSGFGMVPKVEVVGRDVFWRGPIHLTPLMQEDEIDAAGVAELVAGDYSAAGISPGDLATGAVIITGETARKRNARQVTESLSQWAGDFVTAAAGPDLESLLAGRGAGADSLSLEAGRKVINIDIGGGTSNISVFEGDCLIDCACADIGGRLIRLDEEGMIEKISPKLSALLPGLGLSLAVGDRLSVRDGETIAAALAGLLAQAAGLLPMSEMGEYFITNHALMEGPYEALISFSGGVAGCMFAPPMPDFAFRDIGVLLGRAILKEPAFQRCGWAKPKETIRATVVGAGSCSMEVSGSTIAYQGVDFPIKNLPVAWVPCADDNDIDKLSQSLERETGHLSECGVTGYAVAMDGPACPSFVQVERIADILCEWLSPAPGITPVVTEHDFAKALGQALRRRLGRDWPLLCIDGVSCRSGDYIDLGSPLCGSLAVPVVVKTLIFMGESEHN